MFSKKELEKLLLEAGDTLLDPSLSSPLNLLPLLDNIFIYLSEATHLPSGLMHFTFSPMSPLMRALVDERLFKHSDINVKVAVAACISVITIMTAPDPPYDDDTMKEVFELFISSFEHLWDVCNSSYNKRIAILENVSRLQLCNVVMDLECDALLIKMFHHFLTGIREHHPAEVFLYMENIMTLVLNDSGDINPEMLSQVLNYVKKGDEVPQISQRLAEQVLTRCATKCKRYLAEAVISSGVSLDNYTNVVALTCEGAKKHLKQKKVVVRKNKAKNKASVLTTTVQTYATKDTDSSKKQDDMNAENGSQQLDSAIKEETETEPEVLLRRKDLLSSHPRDLASKTSEAETANFSSPSKDVSHPVKALYQTRNESLTKEAESPAVSAVKATPEEINASVAKLTSVSGKKVASSSKATPTIPPTKKNSTKIKATKQSEKKSVESDALQHSSKSDGNKLAVSSGKSVTMSKREVKSQHLLGKKKASDLQNYGENLVGSRIKVWWPLDKEYYKAVVKSYNSSKKEHMIWYDDGDQEDLSLEKHKWCFVDESESSMGGDLEGNQVGRRGEEASIIPQNKKAKTYEGQSKMDILSPISPCVEKDNEAPQVSRRFAEQVLSNCTSQLKTYLTEALNSSSISIEKHNNIFDSICEGAFNALKQKGVVATQEEDKQKAAEVSTPEQTCVHKRRLNLSCPRDLSFNAAIKEREHVAVSPRRETVSEAGAKTHEMVQRPLVEEEDPAEAETWTCKRARVEVEPSCHAHKSSPEPEPCSVTHQLAKVKKSIVETLSSVRQFQSELKTEQETIIRTLASVQQFQSEIKKKEDNLETSLHEIEVLGEKISGVTKILS